jgi:lipopolysaccharide/colanic/teichoic acid biosynthesis glycosyltransferase
MLAESRLAGYVPCLNHAERDPSFRTSPGEDAPMSALTPMSLTPYERPPVLSESSTRVEVAGGLRVERARSVRSVSKRVVDFVGALGGLIFLAPVLGLVAALVRLDSKGPILFRQRRMGLGGQPFWCLKFRTMVPDAEARLRELEAKNEAAGGVLFKIRDDPRVTPLGRFLRRTSLDELPQLWNVLVGEMSLVGPRPLQLRDSAKLEELDAEAYNRRLSATPGVTGPWQVGGRSEVGSDQMLQLDIEILLKTVVVVLAGRGAC